MKHFLAVLLVISLATACSDVKPYKPDVERKNFFYPVRQSPPQPVYSRLTYVLPPDGAPQKPAGKSADTLVPQLHLEITNSTLENTARALADTVGYHAYTSAQIAKQPFSSNLSGTLDDIAQKIASVANIEVVVDHGNREIRFLPFTSVAPRLLEDRYEHQSDH